MIFKDFKKNYQVKKVQEFSCSVSDLPCLSICVQAYEHVSFIKECLDGLLFQKTTFPFEILLGDDDSTDGTRELCIAYAEKFPNKIRLFLHHRENNIKINGSPTGRFNFLYNLYNARGKYIALCEGDDYWTDPFKLQKQVDFLEANPDFSLCFHNVTLLNTRAGNNDTQLMHSSLEKDVFTTPDLLKQWFIPTASILFRKTNDFNIPNWFVNCASGDIPLLLLLSLEGKIKYLDEVMGCYRLHDSGISTTHNGYDKVFSMIYIYQNFNKYSNYKFNEKIREAMIYETRTHLPEIQEFNQLKRERLTPNYTVTQKMKKFIKNIMK